MTMTEKAKAVRVEIKKELGFNSREVKVRKDGCAINVKLDSIEAVKKINEIEKVANKFENVRYDERTGEILGGGNTFVFVEVSDKIREEIRERMAEKIPYKSVKEFEGRWEECGIFLEKVDNFIYGKFEDDIHFRINSYNDLFYCLMLEIIKKAPEKLDYFLK